MVTAFLYLSDVGFPLLYYFLFRPTYLLYMLFISELNNDDETCILIDGIVLHAGLPS